MNKPAQYDHTAEMAVLGSILIDPAAIFQVSDFLHADDFHSAICRDVFVAMTSLSNNRQAIDTLTVLDKLKEKTPPKDGWEYYVIGLLNEVPTSVNIEHYARIVEQWAVRRRMTLAAQQVAKLAGEEGDLDTQLGQAEMAVFGVRQGRAVGQVSAPMQYISDFLSRMEERQSGDKLPGLPTGFIDLDKKLNGMQAGMPYILAARPGMGKSALAGNIAAHLALKENKQVLFFSPEMTEEQMVDRIISGECGVSSRDLRAGSLNGDLRTVYDVAGRVSESGLFIDDTGGLTPGMVRARSMRHYAEHGLDLIIIDHLHEMQADKPKAQRHLELGDMARSLKEVAKLIGCPILIVAQLSRSVEGRGDKRPQLSDLRESGALEEIAFAVMLLYRASYYDETAPVHEAELNIAKHRGGEIGQITLHWQPELTRFRNAAAKEIRL